MAAINPYLLFNGACEAAFDFYKSVFGGEFDSLSRYSEMPSEESIPDSERNKIMHMSFPIGKDVLLMGADTSEYYDQVVKFGDNISLCIFPESEEEAGRIFNALSESGTVVMPLEKTFWGALFGNFVDKFGVCWMVNYCYPQNDE